MSDDSSGLMFMGLPHDATFKDLVRHPVLLRHLVRAFAVSCISKDQVVDVRRAETNLIGPQSEQRYADALWQVRLRGGELVYLVVECQSWPHPAMHWRMLQSIATLALSLSKSPPPVAEGSGYSERRVPVIRGLVVYSGEPHWNVPVSTREWMGRPEGAADGLNAACHYQLLDLRREPAAGPEGNYFVALQRLQQSQSPAGVREEARALRWLLEPGADAALAAGFAKWITQVRLPDLGVEPPWSDDLEAVLNVLEEGDMNWGEKKQLEGMQKFAARIAAPVLGEAAARDAKSIPDFDGMEKFAAKLLNQRDAIKELAGMRKTTLLIASLQYGPADVAQIEAGLRSISDPARLLEIVAAMFRGADAEAVLASLAEA